MGSASRSGPRRGVALAGVAAAATLAALLSLTVATPAAAALSCERVPELLRAYLQKHISFHYLNDELRGRAIDTYLKRLDPSKSLMLVHERAELAQSLKGVFHDVRRGECGALTAIRDNMIERYEQTEKTDMASLPLPRIELLKAGRYMFGSLQISRGCPFTCEFCDIIVTFGRRPRLKGSEQVLAELEAFERAGLKIVFVVDDNLIGNKKAIKSVLRDIVHSSEDHPTST